MARHFRIASFIFLVLSFLPVVCEAHTCFQRIQRARKKVEQRNMFLAQAEIRQTRTRRQTYRPDYVYYGVENSDVCFPNSGLIRVLAEQMGNRTRRTANIEMMCLRMKTPIL